MLHRPIPTVNHGNGGGSGSGSSSNKKSSTTVEPAPPPMRSSLSLAAAATAKTTATATATPLTTSIFSGPDHRHHHVSSHEQREQPRLMRSLSPYGFVPIQQQQQAYQQPQYSPHHHLRHHHLHHHYPVTGGGTMGPPGLAVATTPTPQDVFLLRALASPSPLLSTSWSPSPVMMMSNNSNYRCFSSPPIEPPSRAYSTTMNGTRTSQYKSNWYSTPVKNAGFGSPTDWSVATETTAAETLTTVLEASSSSMSFVKTPPPPPPPPFGICNESDDYDDTSIVLLQQGDSSTTCSNAKHATAPASRRTTTATTAVPQKDSSGTTTTTTKTTTSAVHRCASTPPQLVLSSLQQAAVRATAQQQHPLRASSTTTTPGSGLSATTVELNHATAKNYKKVKTATAAAAASAASETASVVRPKSSLAMAVVALNSSNKNNKTSNKNSIDGNIKNNKSQSPTNAVASKKDNDDAHEQPKPQPVFRGPVLSISMNHHPSSVIGGDGTNTSNNDRKMSLEKSNVLIKQQQQHHHSSMTVKTSCSPTSTSLSTTASTTTTLSDEDAALRRKKIKTEMCMHYKQGRVCPFGVSCTFAHGEEELQKTKLLDLCDAGLIQDVETYRTKPCLTWISTGSCPFGQRCVSLHDPRVAGTVPSWLTHTETQGNTIATDINVEALHQKRFYMLAHDNPFGKHLHLLQDNWSDLYRKVCDIDFSKDGWQEATPTNHHYHGACRRLPNHSGRGGKSSQCPGSSAPAPLHPIIKLQIALAMRGDSEWQYKYRPQHVIFEQFCMVLQRRAFRIIKHDNDSTTSTSGKPNYNQDWCVEEIAASSYQVKRPDHVMVREIAFGPDEDPSAPRRVALYFHIEERQVIVNTPTLAKRFRWNRNHTNPNQPQINNNIGIAPNSCNNYKNGTRVEHSASHDPIGDFKAQGGLGVGVGTVNMFDVQDHFPMIRPHGCPASFNLTTDMMKHRLALLRAERMSHLRDRYQAMQSLEAEKQALRERFEALHKSWLSWAWPVKDGRDKPVDKHTPVPTVDDPYELSRKIVNGVHLHTDAVQVRTVVDKIWQSFAVHCHRNNTDESSTNPDEDDDPELEAFSKAAESKMIRPSWNAEPARDTRVIEGQYGRTLPIFAALRQGLPLSTDRQLPHIIHSRAVPIDNKTRAHSRQQERCWKALLLPPCATNDNSLSSHQPSDQVYNDWDLVREHFQNTRNEKKRSMLQHEQSKALRDASRLSVVYAHVGSNYQGRK